MKTKYIILSCIFCLFLFSCNRNESVMPGSISSDPEIISGGRFTESVINTSNSLSGYVFLDAYYNSEKFYYVFKDYINSNSKIVSFDSNGSNFFESDIVLPFKSDDFSDSSYFDFSGYEGLSFFYYDPYISGGHIEGYCIASGYKYSDDYGAESLDQFFLIDWNMDGSVASVNAIYDDTESIEDNAFHSYSSHDNNDNKFSVTDSGIIRYSADGDYLDTYFDFINSSFQGSFDNFVYADDNLFSAISYSEDNIYSFSIFTGDESSVKNYIPISIYCTSVSDDFKNMVISFNNVSKDYKIGVRNYSDICRDYSELYFDNSQLNGVAFRCLQEDVFSGDIPDLIYEASGYDSVFANSLASSGTILNLKDMLKGDKDTKNNKYLLNIYDLFDDENVYAVIPSFTFDTCIASGLNQEIGRNWSLDDYENFKSQYGSDTVVLDSYTSVDFMLKALAFNGDSWINVTSCNAVFGDDYKTYLELASKLPSTYDDFEELSMVGNLPVNIQVFYATIGNLRRDYLLSWRRVYSDPFNVGFPTNTNSDRVIHPTGTLMLCSDRVSLPGCWEFAKSFLTPSYQDGLTDGIPVLESSYEKWKTNTSYEGIDVNYLMLDVDGQLCTAPLLTDERVELLSNSITSCEKYYFVNPEIEDIVLKNASLYFDGQISVDDAAANTEAEVEEYLKSMIQKAS